MRRGSPLQPTDRPRSASEIVERARRLAQAGGCPADVTKRVAKQMGRSVETIRYTLKQFDQEHPDLAIFPNNTGPLTEDDKKKIYQQYRRGASVETLAKRYRRTKTSIYRVINEMRARRIMELPLDFIPNPHVRPRRRREDDPGPTCPAARSPAKKTRLPSGLAAVPGQPVRSAAADPRAGSAPVPQVQLPEVQGRASCASSSIRRGPRAA